jgi:predicted nuclease of predicted toxin-antitoxin system
MEFKIDENLPIEIAELLQNHGYGAKTVDDQNLKGIRDIYLIEVCKKENRTLVTCDTDFTDINNYLPEEYNGIIVLRLGNQSKRHTINIFNKLYQK